MKHLKPKNKKVFTPEEKAAWIAKKEAAKAKNDQAINDYIKEMEETGDKKEAEKKFFEGHQ